MKHVHIPCVGGGECPTLVIIPGWNESYLKYQEVFYDIHEAFNGKINIHCMDHCSQGLSGRWCSHQDRGWVSDFMDYVKDVEFFTKNVILPTNPKTTNSPLWILAHSMGGLVSSYVVERNPGLYEKVIFSAPMFDVAGLPGVPIQALRALAFVGTTFLGFGQNFTPGAGPKTTHKVDDGDKNECSSYQPRLDNWNEVRLHNPTISVIGGVTWGWLHTSQYWRRRTDTLTIEQTQAFEESDIMVMDCEHECIVSKEAFHEFAGVVRTAEVFHVENSKHEAFFEEDIVRDKCLDACISFFKAPKKKMGKRKLGAPFPKLIRGMVDFMFWLFMILLMILTALAMFFSCKFVGGKVVSLVM